jgi:hypothetical protein
MEKFNEKDLIESIENLKKGYDSLKNYLGDKNKRGLLTTISNNILEIKKYVEYKGFDSTVIDELWCDDDK